MSIKSDVKNTIESAFDMPFNVKIDYQQPEPSMIISPGKSQNNLFDLYVSFKTGIRLVMEFVPQPYAAQMVREMGKAELSKREVFADYVNEMIDRGAKVVTKVNDLLLDAGKYENWSVEWQKVSIKADVIPIEFDNNDKPDYQKTLNKWLPLMMGLSLSLLNVVDETKADDSIQGALEGKKHKTTTNRFERSPINRTLCIAKYGFKCQICGFDFEKKYGELGRNYIHVHHIIPVSQIGTDYRINPIKDLIPVCPNCHAMLHRCDPPITPEELRRILADNNR